MTKRKTRTQILASRRVGRSLYDLDEDALYAEGRSSEHVPAAWGRLEEDIDVEERKVKITLLLDESVAKYFRAQGRGYQARINRVLQTYAQLRIAYWREMEAQVEEHSPTVLEYGGKTGPKGRL